MHQMTFDWLRPIIKLNKKAKTAKKEKSKREIKKQKSYFLAFSVHYPQISTYNPHLTDEDMLRHTSTYTVRNLKTLSYNLMRF